MTRALLHRPLLLLLLQRCRVPDATSPTVRGPLPGAPERSGRRRVTRENLPAALFRVRLQRFRPQRHGKQPFGVSSEFHDSCHYQGNKASPDDVPCALASFAWRQHTSCQAELLLQTVPQ